MKILYVEPLKHPKILDIENDIYEFTKLINCELIECVYPFAEEVVLLCDDTGRVSGKQIPNRKVNRHIIFGPFIIVGIEREYFKSLSDEQLNYYYDLFYEPELIVPDISNNDFIVVKIKNDEY